jgi:hypothetical protein
MPLKVINGEVRTALDLAISFALLAVLSVFVRSLFGMVMREPPTACYSWD